MRDAFLDMDALPEDRLFLTGCPRFDYYASAFAGIELPRWHGHVLVNTNFPIVNPRFAADPEGDSDALLSVGFEEGYIRQLQNENRRVMSGMIDLVAQLASDLPDQQFILRPHPFERWEAYSDALGHLTNVTVDGTGPVLAALRGARAMLHLNCGTAIEALMLGIPPLAPEWLNSEFMVSHAPLPSKASRRVADYGELKELLASADPAAGFDMATSYAASAYPFFHANDGEARSRVADLLEAHVARRAERPQLALAASMRGSHQKPGALQRLQGVLGNTAGSALVRDLRTAFQPGRRAKRFFARQVNEDLQRLAKFLKVARPGVANARHPIFGMPLSTIMVTPDRGAGA